VGGEAENWINPRAHRPWLYPFQQLGYLTTRVTLQAKDADGNNETFGGLKAFFFLVSTSGGQGTFSTVTDNHNGTYTANFKGMVAGNNEITAEIDDKVLTSSPVAFTIA
jgi:adhesin/invasin